MFLRRRSERIEALKTVPLFSDLSQRQLTQVDRRLNQIERGAGSVLVEEGRRSDMFALIVDGAVAVTKAGRRIARLEAGDFFGEMSVLDQRSSVATVSAETAVSLLVIDSRDFSELLDQVPGLQRKLLLTLCARLRSADESLVV